MLYPQLLSGAVAQFPIVRTYSVSNVNNLQEDGSRYQATGVDPASLTWKLTYRGLSGLESEALTRFFQSARGRLLTFTFLDPLGNLLAWSDEMTKPVWEKTPLVNTNSLDSDMGRSSQVSGTGAGFSKVSQILACPAGALLCFSLFARADVMSQVTLAISDASGRTEQTFTVGVTWRQISISQVGKGETIGKRVEFGFDSGARVEVAQVTASPQPAPGAYVSTQITSGVLTRTRFDQDTLRITAAGLEDFGCEVQLRSYLG